jgi:hypothetical protein
MVTVNTGQVAPAGVLPHFVASLGSDGSSLAHMITGSSSIYNPTSTGFTVYIRQQTCGEIDGTAGGTQRHAGCSSTDATAAITPLTATLANQRHYHITWMAEDASCAGAGDSNIGGTTPWVQYCWRHDECTGVYTDITFAVPFSSIPVIVSSRKHANPEHRVKSVTLDLLCSTAKNH